MDENLGVENVNRQRAKRSRILSVFCLTQYLVYTNKKKPLSYYATPNRKKPFILFTPIHKKKALSYYVTPNRKKPFILFTPIRKKPFHIMPHPIGKHPIILFAPIGKPLSYSATPNRKTPFLFTPIGKGLSYSATSISFPLPVYAEQHCPNWGALLQGARWKNADIGLITKLWNNVCEWMTVSQGAEEC